MPPRSIIIPTLNEKKLIENTLLAVKESAAEAEILVTNGSGLKPANRTNYRVPIAHTYSLTVQWEKQNRNAMSRETGYLLYG